MDNQNRSWIHYLCMGILRRSGGFVIMTLEKYEVFIKGKDKMIQSWTLFFEAENFAHAEEQAQDYLDDNDEIVKITKDYKNAG